MLTIGFHTCTGQDNTEVRLTSASIYKLVTLLRSVCLAFLFPLLFIDFHLVRISSASELRSVRLQTNVPTVVLSIAQFSRPRNTLDGSQDFFFSDTTCRHLLFAHGALAPGGSDITYHKKRYIVTNEKVLHVLLPAVRCFFALPGECHKLARV